MIQRSLALLILLWAPQIAQKNARAQTQAGQVVIGDTVQLQSNKLKESRTLFISKPAGYGDGADRYPVLYLLDGETHFRYAAAIAEFLAENDRIPKMLVVGIASGDSQERTHDLTPLSSAETDNRFSPGNGGRLPVVPRGRTDPVRGSDLPYTPLQALGRPLVWRAVRDLCPGYEAGAFQRVHRRRSKSLLEQPGGSRASGVVFLAHRISPGGPLHYGNRPLGQSSE